MDRTAKPNLVFARVGDRSLHKTWITPADQRNWDVQLSAFGADMDRVQDGDLPLSIDRGTKWDSIARYFEANPAIVEAYDYFLFPDDDLLFPAGGIDRLFAICASYELDVAQPALDLESYLSYPITSQCTDFDLRFTNYVETMTPCFSRRQLKLVLPLLQKFPTGWGADLAWTMLSDQPAFKAAVVDAVPITHTRPQFAGDIYKTYEKYGMDPRADLSNIQTTYQNLPDKMLVYGAVDHNGRKVGAFEAQMRNGISLLTRARASRAPRMLLRTGIGMCLRSVTQANYRPQHLLLTVTALGA
ncbi:MAG: DUF707 domain-containing protein [Hyphomonadaceae bacterium]|nr:DUF707 domain-containing protein [Hyphomonadaceae bacterium]